MLFLWLCLIVFTLLSSTWAGSTVVADELVVTGDKNEIAPTFDGVGEWSTFVPAPTTKNGARQAVAPAPDDRATPLVPEAKNAPPASGLSPIGLLAESAGNHGPLLSCSAVGNSSWTTNATSFVVMRQCTLTVPESGRAFIALSGSLGYSNGPYEGQFRIGIDSTTGDSGIDRWVNVYSDAGDGTDKSLALTTLQPVTAGAHTFYALARRYSGTGTVLVYDSTLSVVYIPDSGSDVVQCGRSGNLNWTTTSSTYGILRQCTLNLPRPGWVFVTGDASLGRQDNEYEANFRLGIDTTSGSPDMDRWVNVYNDAGDGSDEVMAASMLKPIGGGAHTFYLLGRRYSGSGTVLAYDPTLNIIYVPDVSPDAVSCGVTGNFSWRTTSSTFLVIHRCTISVPQAGWALIMADGSVGQWDSAYEGHFRIGIDSTGGDYNIDRWVNVESDSFDGTDRALALSAIRPIDAGEHDIYLLGRRYAGSGTVLVYDPTLSIIAPGAALYLPATVRD